MSTEHRMLDPHLSMAEVARRLGVSATSISRWMKLPDNSIPFERSTSNGRPWFVWPHVKAWWDRQQIPTRAAGC